MNYDTRPPMRNPLYWLLIAGRFVAIGLGICVITAVLLSATAEPPPPPPWAELIPAPVDWQQRWAGVRPGLTREEVVSILGPPALVRRNPDAAVLCADTYRYPDYSLVDDTRDLCFDAKGRLAQSWEPGLQFDLRGMAGGYGPLEAAPLGIVLGVFVVIGRLLRRSRQKASRPLGLRM